MSLTRTSGLRAAIRCLTLVVGTLTASLPLLAQDLGSRLAPSELRNFEYDVRDIDSGDPSTRGKVRGGNSSEIRVVRMAHQFGVGYLPIMVMRQHRLIEKHAKAAGLGEIRVTWSRFPSGRAMHDALLTGFLDFGAGGVPPLLSLWDESKGTREVRGVGGLSVMPLYLNTNNPGVRRVEDFTSTDRIAIPATTSSAQAVVLQMAAAKAYGVDNYNALDDLTVSMSHPAAFRALLSDSGGITAHLGSPPYQYQELEHPGVRKLFSSDEVLGGRATFNVLWTRKQFHDENPRTYQAIYDALKAALDIIRRDHAAAARIYILQSGSRLPEDYVRQMISDRSIEYTVEPVGIMEYARFMYETGAITQLPDEWKQLFFPTVYADAATDQAQLDFLRPREEK